MIKVKWCNENGNFFLLWNGRFSSGCWQLTIEIRIKCQHKKIAESVRRLFFIFQQRLLIKKKSVSSVLGSSINIKKAIPFLAVALMLKYLINSTEHKTHLFKQDPSFISISETWINFSLMRMKGWWTAFFYFTLVFLVWIFKIRPSPA